MKTNNLTETFYYGADTDLGVYTYSVMNCPKEHVNLVCNMLNNLAKLYDLEMEDEFYGYNAPEEERLAAEFDLITLCYTEHIAIHSVCLELKDCEF